MPLNKDNIITLQNTVHALNVFQSYLDFNMAGLVKMSNDTVTASNGQTDPNSHFALGMAMGFITELAGQTFNFFCKEYANQVIKIDYGDYFNEHMNNDIIQDNVSDTLSEVINNLELGFSRICRVVDENGQSVKALPVSELSDLQVILAAAKSAAFIACLSLVKHQENRDKQSVESSEQQRQQTKSNLH